MKKIFSSIWVMAALLISIVYYSCSKDLGNYDYHEVNHLEIDYLGDTLYTQGLDTFKFVPTVSATLDAAILNEPDRFRYEWRIVDVVKTDSGIIVGKERNLAAVFNMASGSYKLYFRVYDNKTGMIYMASQANPNTGNTVGTILQVASNPVTTGWMVLCEVGSNKARLDMVSMAGGTPTVLRDVLSLTDTLNLTTNLYGPKQVSYVVGAGTGANARTEVYLITETASYGLRVDGLTTTAAKNLSRRAMFSDASEVYKPEALYPRVNEGVLFRNNGNYYYKVGNASYGYADYALNRYNAQDTARKYKFSPFVGISFAVGSMIFYNEDNKEFAYNLNGTSPGANYSRALNYSGAKTFTVPLSSMQQLLYMEMVRFGWAAVAYAKVRAVFKANDGTIRIYGLNITSSGTNITATIDWDYTLSCTDINKAEQFAVSKEYDGYLFYSVGGKVYQVSVDNPSVSNLVVDLPGTEKVTLLKFHKFTVNVGSPALNENLEGRKLIIGSYDPNGPDGNNGKMSLYTVPGAMAQPEKVATYEGFGKIVSISYKES